MCVMKMGSVFFFLMGGGGGWGQATPVYKQNSYVRPK